MKKSDNLRKLRDFVSDSLIKLDSMDMHARCLISDTFLAKKSLFERDIELNEYEIGRRIKENAIRKKTVAELNDKVELDEKENELFYENVKKLFQSNDMTFELANKRKQCAIIEAKKRKTQLNELISSVANLTQIYENERSDIILSQDIINNIKFMVEKYNKHVDAIDEEIDRQIANIDFRPKKEMKLEDKENIINQPEVEFPTDTVEGKVSDQNKVTPPGIEESINEVTAPPNTEETPISDIVEENIIPKGIIKKNNLIESKTKNKPKNSKKPITKNKQRVKYAKGKKMKNPKLKRTAKKSKGSVSELTKSEDPSSVVPSEILEEVKLDEVNQGIDESNKEKNKVKSGCFCGGSKTIKNEPDKMEEVEVPEEVPLDSEAASEKSKKKGKKSRPKQSKSQSQNRSKRKGNSNLRSKSAPLKSGKNAGKRKPKRGNKKPSAKKQEIQEKKPLENENELPEEEVKPKATVLGNIVIEEPIQESNLRANEGNKETIIANDTPPIISKPKENELKNQLAESNDGEAEEKLEDKVESIKEPMISLDGNQFNEKNEICCETLTLDIQSKRVKQRKLLSLKELLNKMKKSETRYENMLEKLQKQKATSKSYDAGGTMQHEIAKTENSADVKRSKEMSIDQTNKTDYGKRSEDTMFSRSTKMVKSEDGWKSKETSRSDFSKNTKEKSKNKPIIYFENEPEKNNKYLECINRQKKDFLPLLYTNDQLLKKGNNDSKPIVRGTKVIYNYKFLVSQSRKEKDELKEINRKMITSNISKRSQESSSTVSRSGDSCIVMELTPSTEVPEGEEEDSKIFGDDEPMLNVDLNKDGDAVEKKELTQVTSQAIIVISEKQIIKKLSNVSKVEDTKEDIKDDNKQDNTKPDDKNEQAKENITEESKNETNEEDQVETKEDANFDEEKMASINKSPKQSLENIKNPEVVKSNKCGCFEKCSSKKVNKASVIIEPEEEVEILVVEEEEVVQIKDEESDASQSLSVEDDKIIDSIDEDLIPFVRVPSDDEDNIDLPDEDVGNVRLWKKFKYFEQSEDTRDKKLICIIRAKPECLLKRKGIKCDVIKPKDELPPIETKENYASRIFQLSPLGENSPKLDCDMPYLIAIPYAKFNEDSKKPSIIQFNQEHNKWIELLTQTIQFEDVKDAERFVECRLSNPFGIFGVITFSKKDMFTFSKEGISLPLSAEPNIVFSVPEDAVRITIKAVAKATKMRPQFWKEIKNKHEHSDLDFITSSSSIVEIESKRKKLKTPAVISFFCPENLLPKPKENVVEKPQIPIESDSYDKEDGASTEMGTEKKTLTAFQRSLIIPTLSSSTIRNARFLTYTPEEEKWNLVENAQMKFDKNQDQLAVELPFIQSTKCMLVRTKRNTSDEATIKASKLISNEFSVRNCLIALFQSSKIPKEFVLLVSLKHLFYYHSKQLINEGYVQETCNRVFNAELHERQLLTVKFSGNICNVVMDRNEIEFTFFTLFPNIQKITVKEVDNQAQTALKAFRGYLDLYTRALVKKSISTNENKSKKNNNQFVMEEETVQLAHLLLSIPKTSFPNITHFHSFAFKFKDYRHCIKLTKRVSSKIGHNWWDLGINLGIPEARLESLKFHYQLKGHEKIAEQMLLCWLKGCHTYDNKYTMLVEALIKCDRTDIAKNLDSPPESELIFGC